MSNDLASVEVSVSPAEKFEEYLRSQGMQFTATRRIVLEEVFSDHEHFDADQLVERLSHRKDGRRVGRATVYRALNSMVEAGLLRKVARANDREVYEHDYGYPQHDHLICTKTGEMIEFRNDVIRELIEKVAAEHGFQVTGHRLEVYGLSKEAHEPPKRRHSMLDRI